MKIFLESSALGEVLEEGTTSGLIAFLECTKSSFMEQFPAVDHESLERLIEENRVHFCKEGQAHADTLEFEQFMTAHGLYLSWADLAEFVFYDRIKAAAIINRAVEFKREEVEGYELVMHHAHTH